jgi:uncharacterized Zn finger protein
MTFSDKDFSNLENWFSGQSFEQLRAYLIDICRENYEIASKFFTEINFENNRDNPKLLIADIQEKANILINGKYGGYYDIPDYSGLVEMIDRVLSPGTADELLKLMPKLFVAIDEQVQAYDENGEISDEAVQCYEIAVEILRLSSLNPSDKLLWAIEHIIYDGLDLSTALSDFLDEDHSVESWSGAADKLLERLEKNQIFIDDNDLEKHRLFECNNNNNNNYYYYYNYKRNEFSDMLILTLKKSNRQDEILSILKNEVKTTKEYNHLVKYLIQLGNFDEANKYIAQGIKDTCNSSPDITKSLQKIRADIYSQIKDWGNVLSYYVYEFVYVPSTDNYAQVRELALQMNCWPVARQLLFEYLEFGVLPWNQKAWNWPEPDQAELSVINQRQISVPMASTLIEIALFEDDPAAVIKLYNQFHDKYASSYSHFDLKVADQVKHLDPDLALNIWKNKAEIEIEKANRYSYFSARDYLKSAGDLLKDLNRQAEWSEYLNRLRSDNIRKKLLIKILSDLSS